MKAKSLIIAAVFALVMATSVTTGSESVYAAKATGGGGNAASEMDTNSDLTTDNGFIYVEKSQPSTDPNGNPINGKCKIVGYQGTATALTIPTTITKGGTTTGTTISTGNSIYDVVEIGAGAFSQKAGFSTLTIPKGVEKIEKQAFYSCPSLTTVTVSETVSSIGEQAFGDCMRLSAINVTAGNNSYVSDNGVLYGYSVDSAGMGNGSGMYNLIQYPAGNTSASYSLNDENIKNRLSTIGARAFQGAIYLEEIELPDNLRVVENSAFAGCTSLRSIVFPYEVTAIPAYCCDGCTSLESVAMSPNVNAIGDYAFRKCKTMTTMMLPEGLKVLNKGVFSNCSSLETITVPSQVVSIQDLCFESCPNLTRVTLPTSLTSIAQTAFLYDDNITIYSHNGTYAQNFANGHSVGNVSTCTVKFYSDAGALISTQEVVYGSAAVAPELNGREGYALTWSTRFDNVTSDLTVNAIWSRSYTVTFVDELQDRSEVQTVAKGKSAIPPQWEASGYNLSWSASYANVNNDLIIYAVWTDPYTGMLIDHETKVPVEKDTELATDEATYRVINDSLYDPQVTYTGCLDTASGVVIVPGEIKYEGVTYRVTHVEAKALENNTSITTVVIGRNVDRIGRMAFSGCSNVTKVMIKSKKLQKVRINAFEGVAEGCEFKVFTSKMAKYKKLILRSGLDTKFVMKRLV